MTVGTPRPTQADHGDTHLAPSATPPVESSAGQLRCDDLRLAYDQRLVVQGLSLTIPPGKVTVIVGPNACGKSTLLRALARLLKPKAGAVHLDGQHIYKMPTKVVATRLGILPQSPIAPEGLTVADLVARGRYPHQRWFQQWSDEDEAVVAASLLATATTELADRPVDELSGGQRQRAWIAMALAQGTPILLLDEPTTFLDLAHQVEVLDLLADLNAREGRTVVLVLHDLNHACRYAHHLVAMADGAIVAEGPPGEVVTEELVERVFGLATRIIADPVTGTPLVVPIGTHHRPIDLAGGHAEPTRTSRMTPPPPPGGDRMATTLMGASNGRRRGSRPTWS
ncbi:MAG: ABC transporter ATP-binding protein [Actinobacteria bacterium]|nr:ABC transporter ATP-binding protein [Actinomycetota bacterium]